MKITPFSNDSNDGQMRYLRCKRVKKKKGLPRKTKRKTSDLELLKHARWIEKSERRNKRGKEKQQVRRKYTWKALAAKKKEQCVSKHTVAFRHTAFLCCTAKKVMFACCECCTWFHQMWVTCACGGNRVYASCAYRQRWTCPSCSFSL